MASPAEIQPRIARVLKQAQRIEDMITARTARWNQLYTQLEAEYDVKLAARTAGTTARILEFKKSLDNFKVRIELFTRSDAVEDHASIVRTIATRKDFGAATRGTLASAVRRVRGAITPLADKQLTDLAAFASLVHLLSELSDSIHTQAEDLDAYAQQLNKLLKTIK